MPGGAFDTRRPAVHPLVTGLSPADMATHRHALDQHRRKAGKAHCLQNRARLVGALCERLDRLEVAPPQAV